MSISFPFKFVDLGNPGAFIIEANPNFPTETEPVCILNNLGAAGVPGPDTFITIGAGVPPNGPDTLELTFRWATAGAPAVGDWQLDAFLQKIDPGPNLVVKGFPFIIGGAVSPGQWDSVHVVSPPIMPVLPAGVHLYRLYATLRWAPAGSVVKVAGRAEGPLIEFYVPA
jgi:hypothetical protein